MKKLAIVNASLSRGGAERVTVYLSKYMADRGVETSIVTVTRGKNEYASFEEVPRINLTDGVENKNKLLQLFCQIRNLRVYLRENDIDTVLIMGVPLCIYAIPGCIGTGVKIIVSERNDPKHFNGKKIVKYISSYLMKKADGFVFQTGEAKEFYDKYLNERGVVIPNPLLTDSLPEVYAGEREKIIVTAGRLNPQKNQKMLIDAFAKIENDYPEYKLVIYGEGTLEKELKDYVASKQIEEKVLFPGNVSNLLERINSATLFVMTSDFEGMPNALIEAMAIGLPCISTDCPCGGPRELIVDGENGFLVPVGNEEELSKKMCYMLNNLEAAEKISDNAVHIREKLDMQRIGHLWQEYLESVSNS